MILFLINKSLSCRLKEMATFKMVSSIVELVRFHSQQDLKYMDPHQLRGLLSLINSTIDNAE